MARTRIGRGGGCALLLAALLGAGVAGCSADEEPAPAETATTADDDAITLFAMQEESVRKFLPTLVDRENLKEYSLITDTGLTWSADRNALRTVNEQPLDWWGVFAAPEDDIDVVDVRLGENWPEFQDVPIR